MEREGSNFASVCEQKISLQMDSPCRGKNPQNFWKVVIYILDKPQSAVLLMDLLHSERKREPFRFLLQYYNNN